MSQCLRCSKSCEATSVFCEACRSHLRSQLWQATNTLPGASVTVSPVPIMSAGSVEVSFDERDNLWDRITGPQPIVSVPPLPQTPQPLSPSLPGIYENDDLAGVVDQAIQRLNEAAQRIAEVEQGSRRMPRASRLSPLRDISADIQRQSTPLPILAKEPEAGASSIALEEQGKDLGRHMPDLWPWLQEDADPDENDFDQWRTDPLVAREVPNSAQTQHHEAVDFS